jgi:hypothetical protein
MKNALPTCLPRGGEVIFNGTLDGEALQAVRGDRFLSATRVAEGRSFVTERDDGVDARSATSGYIVR